MKTIKNAVIRAIRFPTSKSRIDRLPRAVSIWQIAPGRSRAELPKNSVEHLPVTPAWATKRLFREKGSDETPLLISQFVTAHSKT
jgi:hypothetical protein